MVLTTTEGFVGPCRPPSLRASPLLWRRLSKPPCSRPLQQKTATQRRRSGAPTVPGASDGLTRVLRATSGSTAAPYPVQGWAAGTVSRRAQRRTGLRRLHRGRRAVSLGSKPTTRPSAPGLPTVSGSGRTHGLGQQVRAGSSGGTRCGLGGQGVPGGGVVVAQLSVVVTLVGSPVPLVGNLVADRGVVIALIGHAIALVSRLVPARRFVVLPRTVIGSGPTHGRDHRTTGPGSTTTTGTKEVRAVAASQPPGTGEGADPPGNCKIRRRGDRPPPGRAFCWR